MHALQHALPAVVAALLRHHPMSSGKLALAWQAAVGAAIARASRVALGSGGRLAVGVADGHWQREVERLAPVILGRLDGLLGPGVVVRLDVTVSPPPRQTAPARQERPARPAPASPEAARQRTSRRRSSVSSESESS